MHRSWLYPTILLFMASCLTAGTLTLKNGAKVSGVTIVSIVDGVMTVEKDKAQKKISLKKISSYFDTNVEVEKSKALGDYADYNIYVETKMPDKGKDANGKTTACEIKYRIRRTGDHKDRPRVRAPYFYLYVLVEKDDEEDMIPREVLTYYFPKQAKVKTKGGNYDEAAILEKLIAMNRPEVRFDQRGSLAKANMMNNMGDREVKISLKSVKERDILAWHLDVWGARNTIVKSLDGKAPGVTCDKNWWKLSKAE